MPFTRKKASALHSFICHGSGTHTTAVRTYCVFLSLERKARKDPKQCNCDIAIVIRIRLVPTQDDLSTDNVSVGMDDKEDRLRRRREKERRRRALESAEQRELRLSRRRERERAQRAERSSAERQRLALQRREGLARETDEQREARLQRLRDNKTRTLNIETTGEREKRLEILRDDQQQRLANETVEERERRLQLLSDNQRQRLAIATESAEERERRLQLLSDNQRQRLATETEEDRTIRLQRLQTNRSQQLVIEDEDEIERRRQDDREGQRRHRELELLNPDTALSRAQAKMATFHAKLANLEMSICDICLERSHTKKTQLQGTQRICTRCKRAKTLRRSIPLKIRWTLVQCQQNYLDLRRLKKCLFLLSCQ